MSRWNYFIDKAKDYAMGVAAAGKKNAPSLMTAGSIILGWTAGYLFWKQSQKAEKRIEYEERKLDEQTDSDIPPEERPKLSRKDKIVIYLQYCWTALVLGVGSSGLAIGANKLNLSRLAEMYMLTQFMQGNNDKQNELIEKLRAEVGDKKFAEMKEEMRDEQFPKEDIQEEINTHPKDGKTFFIDRVTGNKFWKKFETVKDGINEIGDDLEKKRDKQIAKLKRSLENDPYFVKEDSPFVTEEDVYDEYGDVYSAIDMEEFVRKIGEIQGKDSCALGELMEFRYYGGISERITDKKVLDYERFVDPEDGYITVCYLDYRDLLSPTQSLMEKD